MGKGTSMLLQIFPRADPLLIDLLEQIMLYSPKQRLTAAEALAHEYFDEIREESLYERLVKSTGVEGFFDLSEGKCGIIQSNYVGMSI